jgi:hypothetical protein
MKRFRRVLPLVLSASGFAAACIGASTGCGSGDDNSTAVQTPATDSGTDGTVGASDASKEAGDASKEGSDATVPDSGVLDTGTITADTGTITVDTGVPDARDAGADVTTQTNDGGEDAAKPDTGVAFFDAGEAGITIGTFAREVATAVCQSFATCCVPPSGMVFDSEKCITTQSISNFNESVNLGDAGDLTLDQAKAQACLDDLATVDCPSSTGTQVVQQFSDCYQALVGTLGTGASCTDSIECGLSDFCDLPLDGGAVGTCQALRTTGGPCGDFGSQNTIQSEQACSHRGAGLNGLRCSNADLNTGDPFPDAASWLCEPEVAAGSGCNLAVDCTTKLCDPGANNNLFQCVNSKPYVYPANCTPYYSAVDAGDGG